jgi:hypothetical protein
MCLGTWQRCWAGRASPSTSTPSTISWAGNRLDLVTDKYSDEMGDLAEVLGRQGFTIYLHSLNHLLDR